ncbi:MAG: 2-polyprenylphenol 6-hydroxylase [Alphaproteobacteria bacterium]|nr:2-polyprenylphenol 6-hydroxylase [Alphaproteobacteria bacterium]
MVRILITLWGLFGILRILIRHGVTPPPELVEDIPAVVWLMKNLAAHRGSGRRGQRLAKALVDLGPSYVKLGQSLATRADVVGEEIAADLSALQDRVPAFAFADVTSAIEDEFNRPLGDLFASFEKVPVAAASISQVHFAVTPDGREVAVKVLRPGVEERFAKDLRLFRHLAYLAERYLTQLRRLKPVAVVEVFADSVALEMDLRMEAAAASELSRNFADDPRFRVPSVDWRRTSRRVMTQERVRGTRIDRTDVLKRKGHDLDTLLLWASEIFFLQVFRDGFFHADMHPGNMFVDDDGTLVPVDFGIMGRLDPPTRYYLADMMIGFLSGNYEMVADVHFRAGYIAADQDRATFQQACRSIGEPLIDLELNEISIARLLAQLFEVTETFEMETQPQLLLLQKTMLVAEGVGRALNPRVNMWELARPLIEDWVLENRGPEARLGHAARDAVDLIGRLPDLASRIDKAAEALSDPKGVRLHPETVGGIVNRLRSNRGSLIAWIAVLLAILALMD